MGCCASKSTNQVTGPKNTLLQSPKSGAAQIGRESVAVPDTHVTIVPYFTVPEGKMDEFKTGFKAFYENTKAGTKQCLFYGFAVCGNKVFCREAYKNAEGVLDHLSDVKAPLDVALSIVGEGGLDLAVMGPATELEKLKSTLEPLGAKFWETDKGSFWMDQNIASGALDTHVTIAPYFTVPEGQMDVFKSGFSAFYESTKAGTEECLYYGFTVCGNKVFCREGYTSAEGVLAHLSDVKAPLNAALSIVGEGGLELAVMGPAAELEKLKGPMGPLGTKFWEIDGSSFWMNPNVTAVSPDTHVTIAPYFTVPEGNMVNFKKGFSTFYENTKAGTKECLYYGFAVQDNKVFCREGYKSAEGVLEHLNDVKVPLDAALAIVGDGGLDLAVMGPAAELEKLKGPLGPLGAKFWEIDSGSFWTNSDATIAGPDVHVTIVPYFTVPEGKMDKFKKGFSTFYGNTRAGTKECLYYGFAVCGNQVFCREGYKNAEGVLAHLSDVKAPLDAALAIVGKDGLDLAVMGPAAELDKLKGPLGALGTKFFETDAGSFWIAGTP